MSSLNFVIVTFVEEDDAPGIVASNWLIDTKTCYYPNVRSEEMKNKLLKRMVDAEVTWPQYNIRILKSYETYGEARLNLKKAEETSNLDSDEEVGKRKRKINKVYLPGDEDSNEDYPFSKMSQAQKKLSKTRNDHSKYPTPPSKSVILAEEVQVKDVNYPNEEEVNSPEVNSPPENELTIIKEAMDLNSDVPVIFLPSSSQQNELGLDFSPDVEITSKEAKKTQVNCQSGSDCITSKQFAVQQTHLIQIVTDLSLQVAELNRKVDILLAGTKSHAPDDNPVISELLASLPVKDEESFDHWNNELKINQNKQAVITFLAGIGGRNVRSLTTNMLRRILLDNVAELYSLTGKQMKNSSKKSFLHTETFKLIFQICKKVYEDVTENDVKEIISDWLNQAKVRTTRRAERQNKD